MNPHKNLSISAVATAPSPATSGTSLVVAAGQGTRLPAVPFNATVWPTGATPDPSNAEIVKVTVVATDTLTIVRAQEGSTARSIVATDQIAATITQKDLVEPSAVSAPAEDVYVPAGQTLFIGDELDCATNNVEVVLDGEALIT